MGEPKRVVTCPNAACARKFAATPYSGWPQIRCPGCRTRFDSPFTENEMPEDALRSKHTQTVLDAPAASHTSPRTGAESAGHSKEAQGTSGVERPVDALSLCQSAFIDRVLRGQSDKCRVQKTQFSTLYSALSRGLKSQGLSGSQITRILQRGLRAVCPTCGLSLSGSQLGDLWIEGQFGSDRTFVFGTAGRCSCPEMLLIWEPGSIGAKQYLDTLGAQQDTAACELVAFIKDMWSSRGPRYTTALVSLLGLAVEKPDFFESQPLTKCAPGLDVSLRGEDLKRGSEFLTGEIIALRKAIIEAFSPKAPSFEDRPDLFCQTVATHIASYGDMSEPYRLVVGFVVCIVCRGLWGRDFWEIPDSALVSQMVVRLHKEESQATREALDRLDDLLSNDPFWNWSLPDDPGSE